MNNHDYYYYSDIAKSFKLSFIPKTIFSEYVYKTTNAYYSGYLKNTIIFDLLHQTFTSFNKQKKKNSKQQCLGMIGIDGVCFYDQNTVCQGLQNCSQITNLYECEAFFQNACILQGKTCLATQCTNYQTPASCTYVVASLLTGQIQMCSWDAQTQKCINLISQKNKNFSNCAPSTALTYRWVPLTEDNIIDGYCTPCGVSSKTAYAPGQCESNQLYSSFECEQNSHCVWNGSNCYNTACSSIQTSFFCSITSRCAWSASNEVCQPFTQCSDLAGIKAYECLSYAIHCTAVSTTKLHNKYYSCEVQTPNECQSTNQFECETLNVYGGVCISQNNLSLTYFVKVKQCNELTTNELCQFFPYTCQWQSSTSSCSQITSCGQLSKCTYYFSELSNITQFIFFCQLNDQLKCVSQQNAQNNQSTQIANWLDYSNCYSNTLQMELTQSSKLSKLFLDCCIGISLIQMHLCLIKSN